MLIACPNCATSYRVDRSSLGENGRTVRCARCKTTWFAGGSDPQAEAAVLVDGDIAATEIESPPLIRVAPAESERDPVAGQNQPAEPGIAPKLEEGGHTEPALIADAPSLVPPIEHASVGDAAEDDFENVESFAARRQRLLSRRRQARRSSRWTVLFVVLLAFNATVIAARNDVVRYLPQTASLFAAIGLPVNLRQLTFDNVRISRGADNDGSLTIEGNILNLAAEPLHVPKLRFAARNASGQEIYTWTQAPPKTILGPGQRLDFNSRLAAAPEDAKDVMVRFVDDADPASDEKHSGPAQRQISNVNRY